MGSGGIVAVERVVLVEEDQLYLTVRQNGYKIGKSDLWRGRWPAVCMVLLQGRMATVFRNQSYGLLR